MEQKTNLILLHGALGSMNQFEPLMQELEADFNCHTFNFGGHGGSAFTTNFSIHGFVEELTDFVNLKNLHHAFVFGYSMGGYVALCAELLQPGTFEGIFTLGTKFKWTPESAQNEANYLVPAKMEEKVPDYANYLKQLHGDNWKELVEKTASMMLALGENPLINTHNIAEIEIPLRIGLGDRDKMVSLEETIEIFRSAKNASLMVMAKTPHPFEKVDITRLAYKIKTFAAKT
jgi:pimeloyl-ACP methyl ester carboxylesterase